MRSIVHIILLHFLVVITISAQELDIQGHRGARGLLPENTIVGFLKALDEGVTTLELDLVITKDKKVVISHEPYMSSAICSTPDGKVIDKSEARNFNIYEMDYSKVASFDCGLRGNKGFPDQQKMAAVKPLLSDMIETVEAYLEEKQLPKVSYNIEIKSSENGDNIFHPAVKEFSDLVFAVLNEKITQDRYNIQSFDFRVLKYWHENYSEVALAVLISNAKGVEQNLKDLGFIPEIYSPNYRLLSKKKIETIHELGMKVIPWTVNKVSAMQELVDRGVDGLITDYPNLAKQLRLK